jgi:hypothetical protein
MASWLVNDMRSWYSLDVGVEDGQVFLTYISDRPEDDDSDGIPLLRIVIDGMLSMFLLDLWSIG